MDYIPSYCLVDAPLGPLQSSFVLSLLDLVVDFGGLLVVLILMLHRFEYGLMCCLGVFRVLGLRGNVGLVGLGLSFVQSLLGCLGVPPDMSIVQQG